MTKKCLHCLFYCLLKMRRYKQTLIIIMLLFFIFYSSAVRIAPQMFKTGMISMYLTVILTFFSLVVTFSLMKKNRTLEQCILITCVGETQTFLLHCLVIICDNHLHIISLKIRIKEFQIALFIQNMRCLKNQPGFYYLLSLYFYFLLF